MPKMKTNKGAAKRFKKTANGYKFKQAGLRHILTKRRTKLKNFYVTVNRRNRKWQE